ncbi:MAG: sulfatase-like hydrolase/transferase, partial [Planctomycetota bacterium]
YGSLAGAVGMYDHRYRSGPHEHTWHRDHQIIDGGENGVHATDLVTREAIRVIEESDGRPFFLYVPFHSVHTPLDERGPFVNRPTQRDPKNEQRWLDEDRIRWFNDPDGLIQQESDAEKRLLLAAVHHLDDAVGQIVAALHRRGTRENTLILFSSDNGPQGSWSGNAYPDDLKLTDFNQPLPFRGKKLDVWEGGIRVPAFANWPARLQAGTRSSPMHIIDWFPTLAAIAGVGDVPSGIDGINLRPHLLEGQSIPERDLYWTWHRKKNRWALRHQDWKIVSYGKKTPSTEADWQLFNLESHVREQDDRSVNDAAKRQELHQRFLAQQARDR